MSRKDPQLNLRLPADLKEMLETAAEENNRSVTAETVERLRGSFSVEKNSATTLFMLTRLEMRLAESQMESLRYYTAGSLLLSLLKTMKEAQADPKLHKWSEDTHTKVDVTIEKMNALLGNKDFEIDVMKTLDHLYDEHAKLKKKSETMFDDMLKATKR